jgi:hypothetical protein
MPDIPCINAATRGKRVLASLDPVNGILGLGMF